MKQELYPTIRTSYRSQLPGVGGVAKMALIAPLYLSMVAGTGGAYTAVNLPLALNQHQNQIFEIRGLHTRRNQLLTVSEHLANLREILGLRMSELSQILGVTRPAAYAWINGVEPKPEAKTRILRLSRLVEELRGAGFERVEMLARQPIEGDRSLIDLLRFGHDAQWAIARMRQAVSTPVRHSQVQRDFGPSSRKRTVSIDAISVPIVANPGERS